MLIALTSTVLLALSASPEIKLEPGTVLSYRGNFAPAGETANANLRKSFDLTLAITEQNAGGAQGFWLIEERGKGAWPWPQRFGAIATDGKWQTSGRGATLLYDRGEAKSVVQVGIPLLPTDQPLAAGLTWRDERLQYTVEKQVTRGERDAWQISASDSFGRKRTIWRDANLPIVLALRQQVTIGQGEEHQLEYELTSVEMLSGEVAEGLATASVALKNLLGRLNIAAEKEEVDFSDDELKLLESKLPEVAKLTGGTTLEKLLSTAQRDLQVQSGRAGAVNELVAKAIGKKLGEFKAMTTENEELTHDQLQGKVTVLHFWEYRDTPLKEPYGQVGYLDFLYHQRGSAGVKVYGVAVDGRLADEATIPAARRSARKLKEFMNLSYPVLLDRGDLLKQLGDPRVLGASLPLFVVIGADGAVSHFHVGMYEVTREQGLKELDEAVSTAMKRKQ